MKEEIIIRIFSAIILSVCTGSIIFLYWKILCKCFMNQWNHVIFELGVKLALLCYYVPIVYIVLASSYEDGFLFGIPKISYYKVINILLILWMIGIIVSTSVLCKSMWKLAKVKKQCFECKTWIKQILEECKKEMEIKKDISLVWGYQVNVPMISGLFQPCIFLPVKEFSKDELKICLYHELNHYKRHDILWNYLSSGIICIHWYFPLVRKVWREIDQWSEISCDIKSIQYVGSIKKYFYVILAMSEKMNGFKTYTVACLFENISLLEKRIKCVSTYIKRKQSKGTFMFLLFVVFLIASGTSVYAMADKYHDIYVKWVKEKTVEIEETNDENSDYKKMDEIKGELKNTLTEKTVKVNLKGDSLAPINHTIDKKGRIRYKNLYVKKGQQIDVCTARDANGHKIRIGISHNGKNFRYVEDKGEDEVGHIFNIEEGGKYDVYIENLSDKKLKIVGALTIVLEGEKE